MLRLVLGRARSGKSTFIFQDILKALEQKDDRTRILLVPEQFSFETERDLMEAGNLRGLMRVEVLSFQRLAHRVFTQVGEAASQELNELGRMMILRHIIHENRASLRLYHQMPWKEGFLADLNHLLVELMQNRIDPGHLHSPEDGTMLSYKLQDISLIYKEYRRALAPLHHDREERFHLLAKKIPKAAFLQDALIWMDGYRGFTIQEYLVLEALLPMVQSMTVALTLDMAEGDPFEPTKATYRSLLNLATVLQVEVEEEYLQSSHIPCPPIQHLERYLYGYPAPSYSGDASQIRIYGAQTPQEEVEEVAKEILSLVRTRGCRFREMAIVTGSMDRYNPLIQQIFPGFGIPFFLDEKRPIIHSPIIRCILAALQIVIGGFQYRHLFTFLKTGFGPLSRDEWEELEHYVREWGIGGEDFFKPFTRPSSSIPLFSLKKMQGRLLQLLSPFYHGCQESKKASQYTRVLECFLQELGLKEQVEDWRERLEDEGQNDYRDEVSQTLDRVEEVFSQLDDLLGEEEMDLVQYYMILESGFSRCELGVIPPTLDQVMVGDLERSRSRKVTALFLFGVNDGVLPAFKRGQGLFLEKEKERLKRRGLALVDSLTLAQEERFNLYSLLSRPREYLFLTYALTDSQGQSQEPSLLIKRLEQLFPGLARGEMDMDIITSPANTFQRLIYHLQGVRKGKELPLLWRQVFAWYAQQEEWKDALSDILTGFFPTEKRKNLGEEAVRDFFPSPLQISMTQLERFLNCPFAHFVQYMLRPLERQVYRVRPLDLGNILHKALETFARTLNEQGLNWSSMEEAWGRDLMGRIIQDSCGDYHQGLFSHDVRGSYYLRVLENMGRRAVSVIKKQLQQGAFQAAVSEVRFQEGSQLPPLKIALSSRILQLEGRIDRLDIWEREEGVVVRIIDYKTGGRKFSLGEAYHGLHIQLLLYLAALMEGGQGLFHRDIIPGGFFYQPIQDPLLKDPVLEEDVEVGLLKSLSLDGFLIGEGELLLGHDTDLQAGERSLVVPLVLKKNGEIAKKAKIMHPQEFTLFLDHLFQLLKEKGEEMVQGRIEAEPVRVNRDPETAPCKHCCYWAICGFDPSRPTDRYRDIQRKEEHQLFTELKGGES